MRRAHALEGTVRRELAAAGATLGEVRHADDVHFDFSVSETAAATLIAAIEDAAQGRVVWQPE